MKVTIRVSGGKYTFVSDTAKVNVEILRYDEPWHTQDSAQNAIRSIMAELDAARVVLAAARKLGAGAPAEIQAALALHGRLVSDRESPSDWCAPAPIPAEGT